MEVKSTSDKILTVQIKDMNSSLKQFIVKGQFINVTEPRTFKAFCGDGRIWIMDLIDYGEKLNSICCILLNNDTEKFNSIIQEGVINSISKFYIYIYIKKVNDRSFLIIISWEQIVLFVI